MYDWGYAIPVGFELVNSISQREFTTAQAQVLHQAYRRVSLLRYSVSSLQLACLWGRVRDRCYDSFDNISREVRCKDPPSSRSQVHDLGSSPHAEAASRRLCNCIVSVFPSGMDRCWPWTNLRPEAMMEGQTWLQGGAPGLCPPLHLVFSCSQAPTQ